MGEKLISFNHERSGVILAEKVLVASGFFERMIGLMFAKDMGKKDGLFIKHCNSIHTFFMKFSIDAVFLDKENNIVKIYRNLSPWKMTMPALAAKSVLELRGGTIPEVVKIGDKLGVKCIN